MNVTYTEKARQGSVGLAFLQQITKRLEEMLGPAASLIKAEWDHGEDDKGRGFYALRLSDWTGAVSANFTPAELHSADEVRYRLHRLWGDLLQVRSEKQLAQLIGAGSEAAE